jgi:hypothetical protein
MTRVHGKPDTKPSREEPTILQLALREKLHLILQRDPNERLAAMVQSMASRSAETKAAVASRKQLFPQQFLRKF